MIVQIVGVDSLDVHHRNQIDDANLGLGLLLDDDKVARLQLDHQCVALSEHWLDCDKLHPPLASWSLYQAFVGDVLQNRAVFEQHSIEHVAKVQPMVCIVRTFTSHSCDQNRLSTKMHRERVCRIVEVAIIELHDLSFEHEVTLMQQTLDAQHIVRRLIL